MRSAPYFSFRGRLTLLKTDDGRLKTALPDFVVARGRRQTSNGATARLSDALLCGGIALAARLSDAQKRQVTANGAALSKPPHLLLQQAKFAHLQTRKLNGDLAC